MGVLMTLSPDVMASAVNGDGGSKRNAGASHNLGSRWKTPAQTVVMTSETEPGREG